jgi:hypothetical protein
MDKDLYELLIGIFEIDEQTAKSIAEKNSLSRFENRFQRLESILGDTAYRVVSEGEVFSYSKAFFDEYYMLALRMLSDHPDIGANVHLFLSISNIKRFYGHEEDTLEIDADLTKHRLFVKGDDQTEQYLDCLIRDGSLTFGDYEHWSKSGTTGARGSNIAKSIAFQLNCAFSDCYPGYKPRINVNFGQRRVEIDEESQEKLAEMRTLAYSKQNGD